MRPTDTSPEAWELWLGLIRKMTPGQKLKRTFSLSTMVFCGIKSGLRQQYPEASEREIFLRAARIRLGPELFRAVYGDVLPDHDEYRSRTARIPH